MTQWGKVENNPDISQEFNEKGFAAFNAADFNAAISYFSQALDLNQRNDLALNNRALAYRQIENYQQALLDIDSAIEINPTESLYYSTRATIFTKLHRQLEAVVDLDKAINIEPLLEYVMNKIVILKKLNRYNEALTGIEAVESKGLSSQELSLYKGTILFEIKKFKQAEEVLKPLIDTQFGELAKRYLTLMKSNFN